MKNKKESHKPLSLTNYIPLFPCHEYKQGKDVKIFLLKLAFQNSRQKKDWIELGDGVEYPLESNQA